MQGLGLSERRACGLVHQPRSTQRYESVKADDPALRERMKTLADRHRRFGHPRLHILLRREGFGANHKKTHRIYVEEKLQVRRRKRKRRSAVGRQPLLLPAQVGERWSMDFMADQLSSGRRFRLFNVIDDYSRECHVSLVDFSIGGRRVADTLDRLIERHGKPRAIVCDNGTEFTSMAMFEWARRSSVDLQFIQPGKPNRNGSCESFNGRMRAECLNESLFSTLREAREIIESWRQAYNSERPHSALNWLTPFEFAKSCLGHAPNMMDTAA